MHKATVEWIEGKKENNNSNINRKRRIEIKKQENYKIFLLYI